MTNISRNYNRGKSFRFDGTWDPRQLYKNDDFVQDFVTYKGVLYACKSSVPCMAKVPHPDSAYWDSVIGGVAGGVFTPHVDEDGNLTWTNDAGLVNPTKVNLKGPAGKSGKDGHTPEIGVKQHHGVYYWTVDGDWLLDEYGNKIPTTGEGSVGDSGSNSSGSGKDGVTPILKIEKDTWYVSYNKGESWESVGNAVGPKGDSGITPQLKIQNGYWYVSYDNRESWSQIGNAVGVPGSDGKDGEDGKDGVDGKDGKDGKDGLSAYQIWLNAGNSGSEKDFLESLKGDSVTQTTNWDFWKTN